MTGNNYDPIAEDIYEIEIKRRNKTMRISPETEAMLQAAITRAQRIEQREEEKLNRLRKHGVGLSKDKIVKRALEHFLDTGAQPFHRKPDLEDRKLAQEERDALYNERIDHTKNLIDGQIVKQRAEKIMKEVEIIEEEKEEQYSI